MNSQEREIISGIFQRLEQAASQPRDPETERFITDRIKQQPYAPYAMAQLVYVQEEAIKSLNQQMEELRAEVQRARSQPQQGGGFLSSIFGGGSRQPEPQPQRPAGSPWGQAQPVQGQPGPGYAPQQGGPWGGQQPGGMMGGAPGMMGGGAGGGGFLRGALTTAAGVAGGMVVGSALMNAFKGGHESLGAFSPAQASTLGGGDTDMSSFSPFPDAGAGSAAGAGAGGFDTGGGGADYQDASFDPGDDAGGFGGDSGGGDDWT